MSEEKYQVMILEYLEGNLTAEQVTTFEALLADGKIQASEVEAMRETLYRFSSLPEPEPGAGLEHKFYRMLSTEIERTELAKPQLTWSMLWNSLAEMLSPVKLAYTLLMFGFGFFAAWLTFSPAQQPAQHPDTQMLAMELKQVKEMLFTTLIEQPAAVDRLKAVNISYEIADADEKVIQALFNSLNHDSNVNVRLAAVEALKLHAANPTVRAQLIQSINKQDSPMVQIALADLMQALQEKNAVPQLRQLLDDENTNEFVKDKIKESINVLI
ncbi:HEAT repeat domain-containing protein [Pontibacter sp. SGAir0037]|uniref:HEAT repeat domain-containing protein n=1 Tax=Pontibacter sp. SGAir0037 TaxID=2571030 RepID=UPI0010CD3560|nr:HEAT repeat domain-containing protein [Pontibacter sp. SGAir0037]QCR22584.1 hypothetical protein C1N53_09705 [Pontibacter sp. SGAir0037]